MNHCWDSLLANIACTLWPCKVIIRILQQRKNCYSYNTKVIHLSLVFVISSTRGLSTKTMTKFVYVLNQRRTRPLGLIVRLLIKPNLKKLSGMWHWCRNLSTERKIVLFLMTWPLDTVYLRRLWLGALRTSWEYVGTLSYHHTWYFILDCFMFMRLNCFIYSNLTRLQTVRNRVVPVEVIENRSRLRYCRLIGVRWKKIRDVHFLNL